MSGAVKLAAALHDRNVVAVAADESVRAWISGRGSDWAEIFAAGGVDDPVWLWRVVRTQNHCGSHPYGDIEGAADAIAASLREDPP